MHKTYSPNFDTFIAESIADHKIKIYQTSGTVYCATSNGQMESKPGTLISPGTVLQLEVGSTCTLVSADNRTILLSKPGVYSYDVLTSKLNDAKQDENSEKIANSSSGQRSQEDNQSQQDENDNSDLQ